MASAWGTSWGVSWGNSWGSINEAAASIPPGGDGTDRHRRALLDAEFRDLERADRARRRRAVNRLLGEEEPEPIKETQPESPVIEVPADAGFETDLSQARAEADLASAQLEIERARVEEERRVEQEKARRRRTVRKAMLAETVAMRQQQVALAAARDEEDAVAVLMLAA